MSLPKLRIAFVLPGGGGGGGARVIVRFAQGLRDRGHEVRIFYPYERKSLREKVRETYLGLRYGKRQDWFQTYTGPMIAYNSLTPDSIGSNDVVIAIGVESVLAIAHLPESCGIKVHNSHGMEPWIADRMKAAWALPMPRIVSASYLVPLMRDQGSIDPIFVVHNGVDPDEYYPPTPDTVRCGVGTVYHGGSPKDPATILAVMHKIHEAMPDMPLYMFGTFPRPAGLTASASYVRLPTVTAARELYSRCGVWFCASRFEGFGLPLLEAMACGSAVVSSNCGGPSDIIADGVSGWLTPVGEADALAARILELLQDQDKHRAFVAAATARLAGFTWSGVVGQYEQALRSIVISKQAGPAAGNGSNGDKGGASLWPCGPGNGSAVHTN